MDAFSGATQWHIASNMWRTGLSMDDLADKAPERSGDEVVHGPVENLIVTLQRKRVITDREMNELYGDYLKEQ